MRCRPRPHAANPAATLAAAALIPTTLLAAIAVATPVSAGVPSPESKTAPAVAESSSQERSSQRGEASPSEREGSPRGVRDDEERRDGRGFGSRRRLSPEQIDAIVEVATEVFPDGGDRLREMRQRDPAALERVLGRQARRLFALAMLRQRNPELYGLKVAELRNQMELRTLAARHEELEAAGASMASQREEVEARIRAIAERQIDLGLRVRGLELAAMDEAIRRMRAELAADAENRDAAIAEMVEVVLSGGELPPPEIRPDAGPRGGWSGRGGPGRPDRDRDEDAGGRSRGDADRTPRNR